MSDCEEWDETTHQPFTFPQVKPVYSILRQNRNVRAKKELKPLKCLFTPASRNEAYSDNTKSDISESDSVSHSSLSMNVTSFQQEDYKKNVEKILKETKDENVSSFKNARSNTDSRTKTEFRTPFVVKGTSSLVRRIQTNGFTRQNTIHEENSSQNDLQVAKDGVNHQVPNGIPDRCSEVGRVLKNVSNFDLINHSQKSVESIKSIHDMKPAYSSNKPLIPFGEEENLPNKTPKVTKKAHFSVNFNETKRIGSPCVPEQHNNNYINEVRHQLKATNIAANEEIINNEDSKILFVNGVQYLILCKLGRGGSSLVYQVLDKKTSTPLAVKCVNLDADENTAKGYLKEIEVLSKLQSSNRVIKLIDHEYLKPEKKLYVVMEKGDVDLSQLLKKTSKSGEVSMPMIIYYWTEMVYAVKEIHSHGIVHADLKPANFLLVRGRLKLIDFGIASSIQNDATSVIKTSMLGTCNYMSPEAIQDPGDPSRTKVGYKSDIWSLGCILYNLMYGKTPFQHITNNMLKLHTISNRNHKINFPCIDCPVKLMDILKRCLTYDAKKRPTASELAEIKYY